MGKHLLVSMAVCWSQPAPGAAPRWEPPSANNPREPGGAGGCHWQRPGIRPTTLPGTGRSPALLPQCLGSTERTTSTAVSCPIHTLPTAAQYVCAMAEIFARHFVLGKKKRGGLEEKKMNGAEVMPKFHSYLHGSRSGVIWSA